MYLRNRILPKNTALMHVSIAVILTMASQSTLNPSINLGSTEPSPSFPGLEVAVVAVVAMMVMETVMVQDMGMVVVLKPTHPGSGKAMLKLSTQSPLLVGFEKVRASGP
jgi:hypothetical protein